MSFYRYQHITVNDSDCFTFQHLLQKRRRLHSKTKLQQIMKNWTFPIPPKMHRAKSGTSKYPAGMWMGLGRG